MIELAPPSPATPSPTAAGMKPGAARAAGLRSLTLDRSQSAIFRRTTLRLAGVARRAALIGTLAGTALAAHAQDAPQAIDWQVRVLHAGQTVDTFQHTTTVGQSRTDNHSYPVTLPAGCPPSVEASAVAAVKPERTRTVTVAPLYVEGDTVTLALDVQEIVDDGNGCSLAPRQISASHPGLAVRGNGWTDWAPADKAAQLVYQVRAQVVPN